MSRAGPNEGAVTRRIGVLINPRSGGGRVTRHAREVLAGLSSRGDDVQVIEGVSESQARSLTAGAVGAGLDALVAVGGDGTVNLALQSVVGSSTALGIIPVGTGNDAAAAAGLGGLRPPEAVAVVLAGHTRAFDVGRARTADGTVRHYLCVLSSGFDSAANERANTMTWPSGTNRYIRAMLAELRSFTPIAYEAVLDGEAYRDDAMVVSVGNGPTFGGGMAVCAGADLHDGLLDVVWVRRMSRRRFLRVFPSVYSGRHLKDPDVRVWRTHGVSLAAPGQVAYADGERVGPLPVEVSAVPDGVRMLVRG